MISQRQSFWHLICLALICCLARAESLTDTLAHQPRAKGAFTPESLPKILRALDNGTRTAGDPDDFAALSPRQRFHFFLLARCQSNGWFAPLEDPAAASLPEDKLNAADLRRGTNNAALYDRFNRTQLSNFVQVYAARALWRLLDDTGHSEDNALQLVKLYALAVTSGADLSPFEVWAALNPEQAPSTIAYTDKPRPWKPANISRETSETLGAAEWSGFQPPDAHTKSSALTFMFNAKLVGNAAFANQVADLRAPEDGIARLNHSSVCVIGNRLELHGTLGCRLAGAASRDPEFPRHILVKYAGLTLIANELVLNRGASGRQIAGIDSLLFFDEPVLTAYVSRDGGAAIYCRRLELGPTLANEARLTWEKTGAGLFDGIAGTGFADKNFKTILTKSLSRRNPFLPEFLARPQNATTLTHLFDTWSEALAWEAQNNPGTIIGRYVRVTDVELPYIDHGVTIDWPSQSSEKTLRPYCSTDLSQATTDIPAEILQQWNLQCVGKLVYRLKAALLTKDRRAVAQLLRDAQRLADSFLVEPAGEAAEKIAAHFAELTQLRQSSGRFYVLSTEDENDGRPVVEAANTLDSWVLPDSLQLEPVISDATPWLGVASNDQDPNAIRLTVRVRPSISTLGFNETAKTVRNRGGNFRGAFSTLHITGVNLGTPTELSVDEVTPLNDGSVHLGIRCQTRYWSVFSNLLNSAEGVPIQLSWDAAGDNAESDLRGIIRSKLSLQNAAGPVLPFAAGTVTNPQSSALWSLRFFDGSRFTDLAPRTKIDAQATTGLQGFAEAPPSKGSLYTACIDPQIRDRLGYIHVVGDDWRLAQIRVNNLISASSSGNQVKEVLVKFSVQADSLRFQPVTLSLRRAGLPGASNSVRAPLPANFKLSYTAEVRYEGSDSSQSIAGEVDKPEINLVLP